MKIKIPENLNPIDAIRKCGYGLVKDYRAQESSFSRRLGSGIYPRFHVYINGYEINLHLDQKQASYDGYHAHSGEYNGETVQKEGDRISELLEKYSSELNNNVDKELEEECEKEEKKGFWSKFF